MDFEKLQILDAQGESERLELKKTTGQLLKAGKTLCGFLNGSGGVLLFGVAPDGAIPGQLVADGTLRDIAAMLQELEPRHPVGIQRVSVPGTAREVIILEADPRADLKPFTFDGRAYERTGTTVTPMSQRRYEELLLNRSHTRHRWENSAAGGIGIGDLDEEEILRTTSLGLTSGRMPEVTSSDPAEILDRLGLRVDGKVLNAAVVAFGRKLLPQFPQCQLRMARFRGVDKTEFIDQRQLQGHAFLLLEEAILFLRRHLPTAGRIQPGLFERADEPLFPFEALREALVNALCHRDYTSAGGAVSLAVLLAGRGATPLREIREGLESPPANRTLQEDLAHLRRLGLIGSQGRGRGANYWLRGIP